ncbi:MAG: hypothetical protein JXQ99_28395 [Hyphomicrobiaceae bacterium]
MTEDRMPMSQADLDEYLYLHIRSFESVSERSYMPDEDLQRTLRIIGSAINRVAQFYRIPQSDLEAIRLRVVAEMQQEDEATKRRIEFEACPPVVATRQ